MFLRLRVSPSQSCCLKSWIYFLMGGCDLCSKLSVNPGVKGTTLLFGEPPTWLSYTSREKAQVKTVCRCVAAIFPEHILPH